MSARQAASNALQLTYDALNWDAAMSDSAKSCMWVLPLAFQSLLRDPVSSEPVDPVRTYLTRVIVLSLSRDVPHHMRCIRSILIPSPGCCLLGLSSQVAELPPKSSCNPSTGISPCQTSSSSQMALGAGGSNPSVGVPSRRVRQCCSTARYAPSNPSVGIRLQ